jgi:hypothetical protein
VQRNATIITSRTKRVSHTPVRQYDSCVGTADWKDGDMAETQQQRAIRARWDNGGTQDAQVRASSLSSDDLPPFGSLFGMPYVVRADGSVLYRRDGRVRLKAQPFDLTREHRAAFDDASLSASVVRGGGGRTIGGEVRVVDPFDGVRTFPRIRHAIVSGVDAYAWSVVERRASLQRLDAAIAAGYVAHTCPRTPRGPRPSRCTCPMDGGAPHAIHDVHGLGESHAVACTRSHATVALQRACADASPARETRRAFFARIDARIAARER